MAEKPRIPSGMGTPARRSPGATSTLSGWWARLDRPSRRSLQVAGGFWALVLVVVSLLERWLLPESWQGVALFVALLLAWVGAPLGGVWFGWAWAWTYPLAYTAAAAAYAVEGAVLAPWTGRADDQTVLVGGWLGGLIWVVLLALAGAGLGQVGRRTLGRRWRYRGTGQPGSGLTSERPEDPHRR